MRHRNHEDDEGAEAPSTALARRRGRRTQARQLRRRRQLIWLARLVIASGLVVVGFVLGVWVTEANISALSSSPTLPTPTHVTLAGLNAPAAPAASIATATASGEPIQDVAIVAGHYSKTIPGGVPTIHDTGSVCPDGLKEVDINLAVAQKTLALLAHRGYHVTLMEEFDSRLKDPVDGQAPDFHPRAFLSIHSDACVTGPDYPLATGWKVAHAEPSDNPEADDHLVSCIEQEYSAAVAPFHLTFNANTITTNMTEYHGFRSIVPTTPAAIIELAFMGLDRDILTHHQDELAQGLANGLNAFLQGQPCSFSP